MTGGPGGGSTTFIDVPGGTAISLMRWRMSSAMAWLARSRSPFGTRLIATSPISGLARR